jgi:hypothetical protein
MNALRKAGEELGCKALTIITWDYKGEVDGITCISLWEWLLS